MRTGSKLHRLNPRESLLTDVLVREVDGNLEFQDPATKKWLPLENPKPNATCQITWDDTPPTKYGLCTVSNPTPEICLYPMDADGNPEWREYYGTKDRLSNGSMLRTLDKSKTVRKVATFNPHPGYETGPYSVDHVAIVDSTPRSYEDAVRLARTLQPERNFAPIAPKEVQERINAHIASL